MKNSKWLLVILVILVGLSCGKNKIEDIEDPVDTEGMLSLNVPDGFDWKMTATYDFAFRGGSFGLVKITSADESVVYHKGSYIEGDDGSYNVSVKLPSYITEVKVNSDLVSLGGNGGDLVYDFATKEVISNGALEFDGTDDYVNLGNILELNLVDEFTIEGWAKQTSSTSAEVIFSKSVDALNQIVLRTDVTGKMIIDLRDGSDSRGEYGDYSTDITSGTWFHWAVVYDDDAGGANADKLKLYINGSSVTLAFPGSSIPSLTDALAVNAFLSTTASPFNGSMDEVRIWSEARSQTEISDNYNSVVIPSSNATLEANWRMNEGTGTDLFDETANNYDVTISGPTSPDWITYTPPLSLLWDSDGDGIKDAGDDYPEDPLRAHDNFIPGAGEGTLVFEDLWPGFGDFDFNDLVLGYRFKTVSSASNRVVEIIFTSIIRANGAMLANGFGFELRGADIVNRAFTDLNISGFIHSGSGVNTTRTSTTNSFENGQTYPTVIVIDNINEVMSEWTNTIVGGPAAAPVTITVSMIPTGDYVEAEFGLDDWNPFIFNQDRNHEIHLPNMAPTSLAHLRYFGTFDDDSNSPKFYLSPSNLPWVLDIPGTFEYPIEKATILSAYPHFRDWAEGSSAYDPWYGTTNSDYVESEWRNTSLIYFTP